MAMKCRMRLLEHFNKMMSRSVSQFTAWMYSNATLIAERSKWLNKPYSYLDIASLRFDLPLDAVKRIYAITLGGDSEHSWMCPFVLAPVSQLNLMINNTDASRTPKQTWDTLGAMTKRSICHVWILLQERSHFPPNPGRPCHGHSDETRRLECRYDEEDDDQTNHEARRNQETINGWAHGEGRNERDDGI